jgi:hypothetical protein
VTSKSVRAIAFLDVSTLLVRFFQLPQYYPITTKKFGYDIKIETQRARAAGAR